MAREAVSKSNNNTSYSLDKFVSLRVFSPPVRKPSAKIMMRRVKDCMKINQSEKLYAAFIKDRCDSSPLAFFFSFIDYRSISV